MSLLLILLLHLVMSSGWRVVNEFAEKIDPNENLGRQHLLDELDPTVLQTNRLPSDPRLLPTVGNGHVATVVYGDTVYMNGVFNGRGTSSHRARIPAMTAVNITAVSMPVYNTTYSLHMDKAMFVEKRIGPGFVVTLSYFAHRTLARVLVTELSISSDTGLSSPLKVDLSVNHGQPSADIDFQNGTDFNPYFGYMYGAIKETETNLSEKVNVHIFYRKVPDFVIFPKDAKETDTYIFMSSIGTTKESALSNLKQAMDLIQEHFFHIAHIEAWRDTWDKGKIEIGGNEELTSLIYSCLYYLLSSLPLNQDVVWPFYGLSPGDLAHGALGQDYMGHVFWDQDTWMFPPILMLHPAIARIMVYYRLAMLSPAIQRAADNGYSGAMYPWESAFTGSDVCPSKVCSDYEQHITGDVALALRQYVMMTREINGQTISVFKNIADFWASRVTFNNTKGMYEILGVMPPDEYHWNVNNSAYTNAIAQFCLRLPKAFGLNNTQKYDDIANKMYIPFDEKLKYHPEYDGYLPNVTVKQADVVLMGYPLMVDMSSEVRRNDLMQYEKTTPGGPAMTWSMFAVGSLELLEYDRAYQQFSEQFLNAAPPFNVWTENADGGGAVNFITGMGGFLQSILFGYGGFRILPDRLEFNGNLIPNTTFLNFTGIDYLGGSIDFSFTKENMNITMTSEPSLYRLHLGIDNVQKDWLLKVNEPVIYSRRKGALFPHAR